MYYIYNVSAKEIVTTLILGGKAIRAVSGTKSEVTKEMNNLKRNDRKANLMVISASKAIAKGIQIPKVHII